MSEKILILRNIQNKKAGGLSLDKKLTEPVAIVSNQKTKAVRYVNNDPKSPDDEWVNESDNYILEPYILLAIESFISILSGERGQGKSLLSSLQVEQYRKHFPKNRLFFICSTSYKDDENLRKLPFKQLDMDKLEDYKVEQFSNSLILFDDIDFSDDLKAAMKFLSRIVTLGRKYKCSLIFSTHINSRLNMSPVYKEANLYTTFYSSLNNGNRMLENNLKIPKHIINELSEYPYAFITFNKYYRTIITDQFARKY